MHEFAEHVAAVNVPALHEDIPDTVYPKLHVGWHVDPLAIECTTAVTPTPRLPLTASSSQSALLNILALAADQNTASSVNAYALMTSFGSTTLVTAKANRHAPSPAVRSLSGSSATSVTATEVSGRPSAYATASRTTFRRKIPAAKSALKFEASYPCRITTGAQLHVGLQMSDLVQSPAPPFVGAADASHGFAEHVAAVSIPALHEDVPDTVYPELHVG